jgi:hypothetical protein
MAKNEQVDAFLSNTPRPEDIRQRIAENLRERQVLRTLLKLSQDRYPAPSHASPHSTDPRRSA